MMPKNVGVEEVIMDWRDYCIEELAKHRCFVSAMHKLRFIEMHEMAAAEPFFSKGLCKCLFLAAWDQKDTENMKQILAQMAESGEGNAEQVLSVWHYDSPRVSSNQKAVYELARDFIQKPGETPDESCLIRLSKAWTAMGDCALQASEILDRMK